MAVAILQRFPDNIVIEDKAMGHGKVAIGISKRGVIALLLASFVCMGATLAHGQPTAHVVRDGEGVYAVIDGKGGGAIR
jgi:hypothetical protein